MTSDSGQALEHATIESSLNDIEFSHNLNLELLTQLFVGAPISQRLRGLSEHQLSSITEQIESTIDVIIATKGERNAVYANPDYIGEDIHAQRFLLVAIESERQRRNRIPRIRAALARLVTRSNY